MYEAQHYDNFFVWPLAQLPDSLKTLALLNPMAIIVEGYRSAFGLSSAQLPLTSIAVSVLIVSGVAALAFATYRRYRPREIFCSQLAAPAATNRHRGRSSQ